MKVFSGILMLLGLMLGFLFFASAGSAPQEAIALVPIIAGYVAGRMVENFAPSDERKILKLLKDQLKKEDK